MKLVEPAAISAGTLTSNVVETPPAAYDAGTVYAAGTQRSVFTGTTAAVYESRVNANLGNNPATSLDQWLPIGTAYALWTAGSYSKDAIVTDAAAHRLYKSLVNSNTAALTDKTKWLDIGPTNRWAAFDDKTSTQCIRPGSLTFSIQASRWSDTVGLLNLSASQVAISISVDGDELYNRTFSLVSNYGVRGLYSWLFRRTRRKKALVITGLPIDLDPLITITLEGPGDVGVGHFVHGQASELGGTQFGAQVGIQDFSEFKEDGFGGLEVFEREYRRRGSFTVEVDPRAFDFVATEVAQYHARPVLVIGSENYASMVYFGLLKFGGLVLNLPKSSILSVDVDGY